MISVLTSKLCPRCRRRTDRVRSNTVVRLTRTVSPFRLTYRFCYQCQRRYLVVEPRHHHHAAYGRSGDGEDPPPPKFMAR